MENPFALIIEDDEKLADIFFKALRMAEFEAEIAVDGKKALARLKATRPALIVLDLHLPYVPGVEIFNQIRAEERLAKTRVIIVTADLFKAESLRSQADRVLIKPISFKTFLDLVTGLRPPNRAG